MPSFDHFSLHQRLSHGVRARRPYLAFKQHTKVVKARRRPRRTYDIQSQQQKRQRFDAHDAFRGLPCVRDRRLLHDFVLGNAARSQLLSESK